MKYYTGIGARETPPDVCEFFARLAYWLGLQGWCLRSGAAQGADAAFKAGLRPDMLRQIFLPWRGFNGHVSS